ncbi:GAF domain-containing SpoIIE family protein phosphatase [Nocardia sp. NPDC050697]|uniref:PP2C family protein-serine/threonine phosphatase n=1 Tax=Nocardia sp. NPDC050697 TaxID=3155158 RepID=UPI0033F6D2CA
MPTTPRTPWSTLLHASWRSAFDARSVADLPDELVGGLLSLPGVVATFAVGVAATDAAVAARWADLDGTAFVPATLATELAARAAEWCPDRADGSAEATLVEVDPAELAAGTPELASRLAALGATALLVAPYRPVAGPRGLVALATAAAAPVPPDIVTALRQARDIMIAIDRQVTEQRVLADRSLADAILAEASLRMGSSLEIEETLRAVVRMIVPGLADGAAVHIARGGQMELVAVAHLDARRERSLTEHLRADRWAGAPVVQRADRSGWEDSPLPAGLPPDANLDTATISVLRARGRDVGLLTLFHRHGAARRPAHAFLRNLAGRAALAVDNAALYAQQRADVMSLQQHLLPAALPDVPGLEMATAYRVADHSLDVGGDFYGLVHEPGRTLTALMGDVCGRGAPAAALTGLARHTLETILAEGHSPERAFDILNTKMLRTGVGRFLTLTAVTLELAASGPDGVPIRVLSGGHPAPLILRRGGEVEQPDCSGLLVGVRPELGLQPYDGVLRPGDLILLYTDGLTEARDEEGRFFEDELPATLAGLRELPAAALTETLATGVDRYRVGDDAALLAIRHAGGAGAVP